jgi:hypothetical protein
MRLYIPLIFFLLTTPVLGIDAETGNEAAKEATRDGKYDPAYKKWKAQAKDGDARSQYSLGVLNEKGPGIKQGIEQDYAQAQYWYMKAADQGMVKAQYNLANMFLAGRGMKVDHGEALRRFRLAAAKGYPPAQYNLAYMLEVGQGEDQDIAQAFHWYQKAANKGLPEAQFKLAKFYASGHGTTKDKEKAVYWYEKLVAAKAQPDARYDLAMLWLTAEETQEKGLTLLRKVAEEGHSLAQYQLGYVYGLGKGVIQDYEQATFWYYRAARQQISEAQYLLCLSYSLGKGVPVDVLRAHVWCEAASNNRVAGAQEALQSIKEAMSTEQLEEAKELALILTSEEK